MTDVYLKRLVVALGGNAILRSDQRGTVEDQLSNLTKTCLQLVPIIASWYEVVLTHGNGPQVGNILVQNDHSRERVPAMPLDVCGAQSQGQIGYLLQRVLSNELIECTSLLKMEGKIFLGYLHSTLNYLYIKLI